MQKTRVMITGLGVLTSIGHNVNETWQALLAGTSGIGEISQWDLSTWPCHLAGEIKDFNPAKMLPDRKLLKAISRQDVLGINAAMQAIADAGLVESQAGSSHPEAFNEGTGVYVASPGNKYLQQYDFLPLTAKVGEDMQAFADGIFDEIHPMWLLRILPNNVLAYVGIHYALKGINHNISNHVVGGAQALIEAYHAIQEGLAERVIVIGYDIGHEPQGLFYYSRLGVVSPDALRPFDRAHNGTILAEGAAALVLESEQSAKARGAKCYAEFMGGCSSAEGTGLLGLEPQGAPLAHLMASTLAQCDIQSSELGLVVAHGNGNALSDDTEAKAMTSCFKDNSPSITAFKGALGHTLTAATIVDSVLAVKTIETEVIPGIVNFESASASAENLSFVTHTQVLEKPYVMVNSRGFGGLDACLVFKACDA